MSLKEIKHLKENNQIEFKKAKVDYLIHYGQHIVLSQIPMVEQ